jgi:hypothetical protein
MKPFVSFSLVALIPYVVNACGNGGGGKDSTGLLVSIIAVIYFFMFYFRFRRINKEKALVASGMPVKKHYIGNFLFYAFVAILPLLFLFSQSTPKC